MVRKTRKLLLSWLPTQTRIEAAMVSIKDAWKRLGVLSLPAFALAFSVVWALPAFSQTSSPIKNLFSAVHVNDMAAIKSAIAAGADLTAKNDDGKTAADVAVDKGHFIIANHLLSVRSTKLAARRALALTPTNPKNRLRKKPKRLKAKVASKSSPKSTTSLPLPRTKPVAPLRTNTATRVSEVLAHVVAKKAKSKPARRGKAFKYRIPPRKPNWYLEPMTAALDVGKSSGVEKPNAAHIKPSKVLGLFAESAVEALKKPIVNETSSSPNPGAAVGNFFSSLVDLVSPDDEAPKADVAKVATNRSEKKATRTGKPIKQFKTVKESASERTLRRIQDLLGDAPKEDVFGLPIIEATPTRKTSTKNASDRILDRLVRVGDKKVSDKKTAYLDDKPGPETGPSHDLTKQDRKIIPVSTTLQLRLKRLGDAVSRNVQVNTDAILWRGRRPTGDGMLTSSAQRQKVPHATVLTPPSPTDTNPNPQIVNPTVERALRPEEWIKHRQTPADRFVDRVKRIKQLEEAQENKYGIPSGKQRASIDDQNSVKQSIMETENPSVMDRMVGFFGAKKTQPEVSKPVLTEVPATPEYLTSPSARALPKEGPAPEIENLKAFGTEDETKPSQQPGTIEPLYLDRLAGLFNEEEKVAQLEGWKAEIKTDKPFHGGGELVQKVVEKQTVDLWTTTVDSNMGEGKGPVDEVQAPALGRSGGKRHVMAKMAYEDPLREPQITKAETQKKTFFRRLTKLVQPKELVSLERESLLLEQDEKLSTAHDVSVGGVEDASRTGTDAKTYWPITKLIKPDPAPQTIRSQKALTHTTLTDVTLSMGQSVHLENMYPPGKDGTDPENFCVKKNRGTTLFCIDPIDWADDIKSSFMIATILYTGPMAIVRYDQGQASRLHALFTSTDFDKIAAHYRKRFGEPTEIFKRIIAPLAKPRQDNPTISWRSLDRKTNAITVLEIRKYDDTRGGFPDTNRGAAMLYFTTSPSIFPQVSSHELMRLKRIVDITQTEAEKVASEEEAAKNAPAGPAVKAAPTRKVQEVSMDELQGSTPAATPNPEEFEKPKDMLKEPVFSEPRISEPSLFAPQVKAEPEPVTDEQPDETIDVLPN